MNGISNKLPRPNKFEIRVTSRRVRRATRQSPANCRESRANHSLLMFAVSRIGNETRIPRRMNASARGKDVFLPRYIQWTRINITFQKFHTDQAWNAATSSPSVTKATLGLCSRRRALLIIDANYRPADRWSVPRKSLCGSHQSRELIVGRSLAAGYIRDIRGKRELYFPTIARAARWLRRNLGILRLSNCSSISGPYAPLN